MKGRERGVGGDLKGDGYQNGGLLVVGKGGKLLYSFVQENPADHAANEDILKVRLFFRLFLPFRTKISARINALLELALDGVRQTILLRVLRVRGHAL